MPITNNTSTPTQTKTPAPSAPPAPPAPPAAPTAAPAAPAAPAEASSADAAVDFAAHVLTSTPVVGAVIESNVSFVRWLADKGDRGVDKSVSGLRDGESITTEMKGKVHEGVAAAQVAMETSVTREGGKYSIDGSLSAGAGVGGKAQEASGEVRADVGLELTYEAKTPADAEAAQRKMRATFAGISEGAGVAGPAAALGAHAAVAAAAKLGAFDDATRVAYTASLNAEGKLGLGEKETELHKSDAVLKAEIGAKGELQAGAKVAVERGEDGKLRGVVERRVMVSGAVEGELGIAEAGRSFGIKPEEKTEHEIIVRDTYELDEDFTMGDATGPAAILAATHGAGERSYKLESTTELGDQVIKGSADVDGTLSDALAAARGEGGEKPVHGEIQRFMKSGTPIKGGIVGLDVELEKKKLVPAGRKIEVDSAGAYAAQLVKATSISLPPGLMSLGS